VRAAPSARIEMNPGHRAAAQPHGLADGGPSNHSGPNLRWGRWA